MSNPWFRLYAEFAHDPKIQMLSEAMQRRYIMIMCMRCSNALVTLHETEIAFHLRVTDDELAETKALFISKGFIDDKWNLLNWEKRQFVSDSSAPRVARHRQRKKEASNADVTLPKQKSNALDTDTDTDTDKPIKSRAIATRLPADWIPAYADARFCEDTRPDLHIDETAASFRDYWIAQPGVKGRKTDWSATWRNWIRNQRQTQTTQKGQSRHEQLADKIADLTGRRPSDSRVIHGTAERLD